MKLVKIGSIVLALALSGTAFAAKQPHMQAAMKHLKQAQAELAKASHNKGGHRVKAMDLAKQAEAEVQQGIEAGNQAQKK